MFVRNLALGAVGLSALAFAVIRCSGDDGKATLVRVVNEAAGSNCSGGGFQVLTGLDDNGNGTLDDNEIDGTSFACNGEPGQQGPQGSPCDLRARGTCRNADLRNIFILGSITDLSGADLSGSDMRGAVIIQGQFNNANLTGVKLDHAIMTDDTSFMQANLTGASLRNIVANDSGDPLSLDGATLTNADFSDALVAAGLTRVSAAGSKWVGATVIGAFTRANLAGADFSDAELIGDFSGVDASNANFSRAFIQAGLSNPSVGVTNLSGANFSFATIGALDFSTVTATSATFTNAYFNNSTTPPAGVDFVAAGAINVQALGVNLNGLDLRYLKGFTFPAAVNLSDSNLSGYDFDGTNLTGANLTRANLSAARLGSSNLSGANCTQTNFTGADMNVVVVSGATNFDRTDFTRANLRGVQFVNASAPSANFTHATLIGANLSGLLGTGQIWTGAFVRGTTPLAGATGTLSVASGATLTNADLSGIWMNEVDTFAETDNFIGANFTDARIVGVLFNGANLSGANFTNANATYSEFDGCNLTGANFTGADLGWSTLDDANLTNANLTNASLLCAGAGINTSDLSVPALTGVTWSSTRCPDGTNSNDNSPANCENHTIGSSSSWADQQCAT